MIKVPPNCHPSFCVTAETQRKRFEFLNSKVIFKTIITICESSAPSFGNTGTKTRKRSKKKVWFHTFLSCKNNFNIYNFLLVIVFYKSSVYFRTTCMQITYMQTTCMQMFAVSKKNMLMYHHLLFKWRL